MKFQKREEKPNLNKTNNMFLKVPPGDHVIGLMRGEIHTYFRIFKDGKYTQVEKGTRGSAERFRVNIIVNGEDGKPVAKIFEFGIGLNNQFWQLSQEYDLERFFVKIRKEGQGKETKWYVVIPKDQPTEKQLEGLSAIPLNILDAKPKTKEEDGDIHRFDDAPWPTKQFEESNDEIPFLRVFMKFKEPNDVYKEQELSSLDQVLLNLEKQSKRLIEARNRYLLKEAEKKHFESSLVVNELDNNLIKLSNTEAWTRAYASKEYIKFAKELADLESTFEAEKLMYEILDKTYQAIYLETKQETYLSGKQS